MVSSLNSQRKNANLLKDKIDKISESKNLRTIEELKLLKWTLDEVNNATKNH